MPIEITRLETGIYRANLFGRIELPEILDTQAQGRRAAEANGEARHVLIIDIAPDTDMPFDIRQAGQAVRGNPSDAVFVVGVTLHIRLILKLLGKLFGFKDVIVCKNHDEALMQARAYLQRQP